MSAALMEPVELDHQALTGRWEKSVEPSDLTELVEPAELVADNHPRMNSATGFVLDLGQVFDRSLIPFPFSITVHY